jgi:NAD(P)-dependent dehydrogenase (short-subunit alcohol dehydrogenase family)
MDGQLMGKVALVTGSTSGIGAAIAQAMAAAGAAVVVSGRRRDRGEQLVAAIGAAGGRARYAEADLYRPADCDSVCRAAVEAFDGLDILVNNAAIFPRCDLAATDAEVWDRIHDLNVRAPFLCSRAAAAWMRDHGGGAIINIGSGTAFGRGGGRLFAYACSKAALFSMSMKLAGELAPHRIRVNWVTVGWVLTEKEFEIQAGEGVDRERLAAQEAGLPMGQYNTAEEIAQGCVYLASAAAARITGSDLNISAGLAIHL